MKTLYWDLGMGAAGDMLTASLLELLPDPPSFLKRFNALGIPGVEARAEKQQTCGITGTRVKMLIRGREEGDPSPDHRGHHGHTTRSDIRRTVGALPLPDGVAEHILSVYDLLAEAESRVHGVTVNEIHFHEVGSCDALADITAVCLLMQELAPDRVVASPVHVGCGQVACAHGILPVPAPATAEILKGVPIYSSGIEGELCTPTGAALLKHFVTRFGDMPVLTPGAIGYGLGKAEFERANCVRAILGESGESEDDVVLLSCNVDDMTGEEIGFATERLLESGAPEVYTVPIGMKKSRPGTLIRVICRKDQRGQMLGLLFSLTSTIGVRETPCRRYLLERREERIDTPLGQVRKKMSTGYGVTKEKYEYDDVAGIARRENRSLREVRRRMPEEE